MGAYSDAFRQAIEDPVGFWGQAMSPVEWVRAPQVALDHSAAPFVHWFPDGELNTCHNALDRHIGAGRGDQVALIHDSPVTGTGKKLTYRKLRDEVARFAGVLRARGVVKGDRVVIYLP